MTSRSFDLSKEGANIENLIAYDPKNYTLIGNNLNNTIKASASGDDVIDGQAGNDSLFGGDGNDTIDGGVGSDQLTGGKGDDTQRGGAGNDYLFGGEGADWLEGGDGNDTLVGGPGNDVMIGGAGDDTYDYTDGSDEFGEMEGQGIDTVVTNQNYVLGNHLENVVLVDTGEYNASGNELANVLTGNSYANDLNGYDGNDLLDGGAGDDTLTGGTGKDTMRGGQGSDYYYVDNLGDKVIENAGEGIFDSVITTLTSYTLGKNVEQLGFDVGTKSVVGIGNELGNTIFGGGGNDKLDGKAGNDFLDGEGGEDTLTGGDGNDLFDGSIGDDTLDGGAGSDTLNGGSGKDLMIGGAGNDTYLVDDDGDTVQEAANGGIDAISTKISLNLGANIENGYAEIGGLTVGGNALNNRLGGSSGADTLNGENGADVLTGENGADTLNGGAGDDVIEGGLGADKLDGGAGGDLFRYRLENPADINNLGGDLITGFEHGKDKIDLYDLFVDFDLSVEDVIGDGVLSLEVSNGDTLVKFDKDGGADSFVTLATLQGVTDVTLADVIYLQNNSVV
jgi:Ca2+-binding RTX toxin-like protein